MPEVIGSHNVTAFTNPNPGDPLDPSVVKGNDNTLRTGYNSHDGDAGIHLQSSALASRPAFGVAGRKWMTADTGVVRIFYDTGSAWVEASYAVFARPVRTETGNYTVVGTDDIVLANASSGTQTITLPTAVGLTGRGFTIKRLTASGAATIVVATTSSQTIDGALTVTLPNRYDAIEVISTGSAWVIVSQVDSSLILEA